MMTNLPRSSRANPAKALLVPTKNKPQKASKSLPVAKQLAKYPKKQAKEPRIKGIKLEKSMSVLEERAKQLRDQRKLQAERLIHQIDKEKDPIVKATLEEELLHPETKALANAIKKSLEDAMRTSTPKLRANAMDRMAKYIEVKESQEKLMENVGNMAYDLDMTQLAINDKRQMVKAMAEQTRSVTDKIDEFKQRLNSIPKQSDVKQVLEKSRANPTKALTELEQDTLRDFVENSLVTGNTGNLEDIARYFTVEKKDKMSGKKAHKTLIDSVFTTPPRYNVTHKTIYDHMARPVDNYPAFLSIPPIDIPDVSVIAKNMDTIGDIDEGEWARPGMVKHFKEIGESHEKAQHLLKRLAASDPDVTTIMMDVEGDDPSQPQVPTAVLHNGSGKKKRHPIDDLQRKPNYTYSKGRAIKEAFQYLEVPESVYKLVLTPSGLFKKSVNVKKFDALPDDIRNQLLDIAYYAKDHPDRKLTIKQLKLNGVIA